jgi:hypothetical protein
MRGGSRLTLPLFSVLGKRKIYLNIQVDDVHIETELYTPPGAVFRLGTADLEAHKSWQPDVNSRLPLGSDFFLEMCHNGNGAIIVATDLESPECRPDYAVDYPYPPDTPLEFMKPLGTGVDLWGSEWTNYTWSLDCSEVDDVAAWFLDTGNRDAFAHISHTFTHEELNNATYRDAALEIQFNQDWMKQMKIDAADRFSPNGLIPPAITGLHNGDVIRAWMDNGVKYVVGDNTRPRLRNPENQYWPRYTTVEDNGHAGLCIIPRWATNIYYNCDTAACTTQEWIATSGGKGNFSDLIKDARATNTRYLFALHADPYMFHQANLRQADQPTVTVGAKTGRMSLVQIWVEAVIQEMTRLTDWPIQSLKHDDVAQVFIDRMALDGCNPRLTWNLNDDGSQIVGATLTTDDNTCSVPVPVTLPGSAVVSGGSVSPDLVGSEPLILWAEMKSNEVRFQLRPPIDL